MKKTILLALLSSLFIINAHAGVIDNGSKDPQLMSAIELTFTCRDEDTAFIACKAALEKHKSDEDCILFIKELMVLCPVSDKFEEDMQFAADYVIKKSSDPISVGVAWFRKSEHSFRTDNFNESIRFCDIALKNLSYDAGECSVEGNTSTKSLFEILSLIQKKQCYEFLKQPTKVTEVEKSLMNYPAYAKYFKSKCT